jgi:phosphoglucosamine mutase
MDRVQQAILTGEQTLGTTGRLLIRKSGTEPLIRVMAEGEDEQLIDRIVGDIVTTIQESAA